MSNDKIDADEQSHHTTSPDRDGSTTPTGSSSSARPETNTPTSSGKRKNKDDAKDNMKGWKGESSFTVRAYPESLVEILEKALNGKIDHDFKLKFSSSSMGAERRFTIFTKKPLSKEKEDEINEKLAPYKSIE